MEHRNALFKETLKTIKAIEYFSPEHEAEVIELAEAIFNNKTMNKGRGKSEGWTYFPLQLETLREAL